MELNVGRQLEDKDVSSTSLISEMNWSQDKNMIACSSQASSSPRHSPTPYNSWQHISAIYQPPSDPLDKIPRTFHNLKHKYSKKSPSPLDLELDSDNSLWGDKDISTWCEMKCIIRSKWKLGVSSEEGSPDFIGCDELAWIIPNWYYVDVHRNYIFKLIGSFFTVFIL